MRSASPCSLAHTRAARDGGEIVDSAASRWELSTHYHAARTRITPHGYWELTFGLLEALTCTSFLVCLFDVGGLFLFLDSPRVDTHTGKYIMFFHSSFLRIGVVVFTCFRSEFYLCFSSK